MTFILYLVVKFEYASGLGPRAVSWGFILLYGVITCFFMVSLHVVKRSPPIWRGAVLAKTKSAINILDKD